MSRGCLAVGLLCALLDYSAAASDRQPPPIRDSRGATTHATAIVRGRVIAADTGKPLRGALVRIADAEQPGRFTSTTDAAGMYEVKTLPAGRYVVVVTKSGYLTVAHGQRTYNEPPRPIEIANGQVIDKLDFTIPRASAITGRVVDEFGEPAVAAHVQAIRMRFINGDLRLLPAGNADTDDFGRFRVHGLQPGEYLVCANLAFGVVASPVDRTNVYPYTCYRGTLRASEAQRVTVAAGGEVSNISFALIPARGVSISGTVTSATGASVEGMPVRLQSTTGEIGGDRPTPDGAGFVAGDGTFKIGRVIPGEYVVRVQAGRPPNLEFAAAHVTVGTSDVSNLSLATSKGATARGRIVLEDGDPSSVRFDVLRVTAAPSHPLTATGIVTLVSVDADGKFEVKGLFDTIMLTAGPPPRGWHQKAVRVSGVDISDTGYTFTGTDAVTGFEILYSTHANEVNGHAVDGKGQPVVDCTIVVYSTNPEKWKLGGYIRAARPDQSGHFTFSTLVPGEYFAVGIDTLESEALGNHETLARLARVAQRFTLGEQEIKSIAVKVVKP